MSEDQVKCGKKLTKRQRSTQYLLFKSNQAINCFADT